MSVASSQNGNAHRLVKFFVRYAEPFYFVKHIPLFGPGIRWLGSKFIPRNTLVWVQVESGPAAGIWLRIYPRTGRTVLNGQAEFMVQSVLEKYLRPGMVFYDLGANIGFFSLLAARLVGPQGRVVAFEADPEVSARLRENISRNLFSWASCEECAVWSEQAMVTFKRADLSRSPDRGDGCVVVANGTGETITVPSVSLDRYACVAAPPPDFIKCDVEGAEARALQGARRLLAQKRPIVLCEVHSSETHHAVLEEFCSLGYCTSHIDSSHVLALPQ